MTENDIARIVVDACVEVHRALGPGLLESAYRGVLAYELEIRGLSVKTEVPIAIRYKGLQINDAFRADLLINDLLVVELKSLEHTQPVHRKQLLTYLRLMDKRLGLLVNFGSVLAKDGIERIVNNLNE